MSGEIASRGPRAARKTARYREMETRARLAWVARHLHRKNESIFLIERLQPDCLARAWQRVAYVIINGLLIGALTGTILALGWWTLDQFDTVAPSKTNIPPWLWIVACVLWAMAIGVVDLRRLRWLTPALHSSWQWRWGAVCLRILVLFVTSIVPWFLLEYLFGTPYGARPVMAPVSNECVCLCASPAMTTLSLGPPWISSALVALIYGARMRGETDVTPVEATGWSFSTAAWGLLCGLVAGDVAWAIYAWIRFHQYVCFRNVQFSLPLFTLFGAAAGLVIGGLSVKERVSTIFPNQGIHHSLRNGLKSALLLGGLLAVVTWPILMLAIGGDKIRQDGWQAAITIGAMTALAGFVWGGGREVIRHLSLRAILTATRQLPRDLAGFLDHCTTDLEFLREVAGGYMFIHRQVLEYFAAGEVTGDGTAAD